MERDSVNTLLEAAPDIRSYSEAELELLGEKEREKFRDDLVNNHSKSLRGKQLVVSGPGTGKSTYFKKRLEYWISMGLKPENILGLSFINFISEKLREDLQDIKVGTLHSESKHVIHRFLGGGHEFIKFPITEKFIIPLSSDEDNLINDAMQLGNISIPMVQVKSILRTFWDVGYMKKSDLAIVEARFKVSSYYDCVSFSELVVRARFILNRHPKLIGDIANIIVDEYQDFNPPEQKLIEMLFLNKGGVVAGDDDQAIYSLRSGNPSGIRKLYSNKEWEIVELPFCNRCDGPIVESAKQIALTQSDPTRLEKKFVPLRLEGSTIKVVELYMSSKNFRSEALLICRNITSDLISNWKDGDEPRVLVLGASKSHLEKLAQDLRELGLPAAAKSESIFDDKKVQELHSFAQILKDPNNNLAVRRLLGIYSPNTAPKVAGESIERGASLIDSTAPEISKIKERIQTVLKELDSNLDAKRSLEVIAKRLSKNGLNTSVKSYLELLDPGKSLAEVLDKLEEIIISEKERERLGMISAPIQLLTVHSSKGLSANTVFIVGCEIGLMPKSTPISDEDRRLLYVAMTRARQRLFVVFCKKRQDGVHQAFGDKLFKGNASRSPLIDLLPTKYVDTFSFLSKSDIRAV